MSNTQRLIKLHKSAQEFREIGCWAMAQYLENMCSEMINDTQTSQLEKTNLKTDVVKVKTGGLVLNKILLIACVMLSGIQVACASKPKGFNLPPVLSEVYRGGQLKGLEAADGPELGMPNQYDRVTHVCSSTPVYNLYGNYVRTEVRCW